MSVKLWDMTLLTTTRENEIKVRTLGIDRGMEKLGFGSETVFSFRYQPQNFVFDTECNRISSFQGENKTNHSVERLQRTFLVQLDTARKHVLV